MAKNRRPTRDDGCCSVHFVKYILFIFNFLFYLSGLCILFVGMWTLLYESTYTVLLPTRTFEITTYIMIGAGVLVLFVGIVGCVGVHKENRCCLLLYTFLLLFIFLMEAVAGVLAYIYSEQVGHELKMNLNQTISAKYPFNPEISEALKNLHTQHKCCGANSYEDWRASRWYQQVNGAEGAEFRGILLVPDYCCRTPTDYCGKRDHPSNIYYDGCTKVLERLIKEHEVIIGAVALGISTVQIFGMVISCCLYVKLRDFDEYKGRRSTNYYT